jgi:hypothetical protein
MKVMLCPFAPLALLSLLISAGCTPEPPAPATAPAGLTSEDVGGGPERTRSQAHFVARLDLRLCVSPLCGGYFVHQVNRKLTPCADGVPRPECYVAEADLSALGLRLEEEAKLRAAIGVSTHDATVVFRGHIAPRLFGGFGNIGVLQVQKAWRASTPARLAGSFYGLTSSGIVCVTSPCESIRETLLNHARVQNIHEVDLSAAPGSDEEKAAALAAIFDGEGLVATGTNRIRPDAGPAGDAVVLAASQYFRLVKTTSGQPCDAANPCARGLLCCFPCGAPPSDEFPCPNVCMQPVDGACPLFP